MNNSADLTPEEIGRVKGVARLGTHMPAQCLLEIQPVAMLVLYRAVMQIERQQELIAQLRDGAYR